MRKNPEKRYSSPEPDEPAKTLKLIVVVFLVISMIVATDILVRRPAVSIELLSAGLVVLFAGFVLRVASQIELGRNFTYEVKTSKEQTLVTDGIHSVLRHPMYTGLFLIMIGLCICFNSLFGIIASIVLLLPLGIYRMAVEEAALVKRFGKKYEEYMKTTKRVIPFLY
ncbi:isoprenylcysteine carboxylmethyltransferase family protein [Candidatus Woesearchaeota archaeon]|nr:isoprenylcysteine carboxylmethyltransferase family protein [Candidatus Woesearchaeota archaeon]